MAEYIDRDEAVRTALDACIKVVGHGITQFDAVDIAEAIESIATADVVEVRHGEWVEIDTPLGRFCVCSVCSSCPMMEYNYCPYCGAKMDGKGGAE